MDILKQIFPLSFKEKKDVATLIVHILIYVVLDVVAGAVIGLLAGIKLIGWIFGLIGSLLGLYVTAGLVLTILHYFKVVK